MTKSKTILIVEDSRIAAEDIRLRLIQLGYNVAAVVASGEAALEKADEFRPDLVLMDIRLQGELDGIDTAARIHKTYRTPIIYLTAYADFDTLERIKQTGPYGFIVKPFEDSELQGVIETALYKHAMERELQEKEAWLSTTLRSIGDAVIATDAEGLVTLMNPQAENLTGWKEKASVGRPLQDIFHIVNEETGKQAECPVDRVLRDGKIVGLANHTVLIAKDGRRIPIDDSGSPIRDEGGRMIGVVLVFKDITERRKAEEALTASEEKYRTLVDNAPVGIYKSTIGGELLYVNDSLLQISGFLSIEEMNQVGIANLYADPTDRDKLKQHLQSKGRIRNFKSKMLDRNGQFKHILLSATLEDDIFSGVIVDISDREQTEQTLRLSEEKYRTLFETMAKGVVFQNANGEITSANPSAERILGLTLDQMLGRTSIDPRWRTIREDGSPLPGDEHPAMIALKTGKDVEGVLIGVFNPQEEKTRWIQVSAVPQFRPGETEPYQVFATFSDITERREAEQAIRASEARFRDLVDLLPQTVFETDAEGRLTFLNRYGKTFLGYTEKDIRSGLTMWDVCIPEDHERIRANIQRRINGKKPKNSVYTAVKKDGATEQVRIYSTIVREDDTVAGLRGVVVQIETS